MRKTIVIGDIHGAYKALIQIMERAGISQNDTLIFLGDLVDGWSGSYEVIEYLIEFQRNHKCIFIKGNHDLNCEYWLSTGASNENWEAHGGKVTMQQYEGKTKGDKERHLNFFQRMPYFHIDQESRLFIHAGFTSMHGPKGEYSESSFIWDRTLLEMAIATDETLHPESIRYPKRLKHFYEIYIGHTPTQHYNSEQPINAMNLWNLDTGAAFKGKLTAMDIETKEYWQSDPPYMLYPHEKGRNKV